MPNPLEAHQRRLQIVHNPFTKPVLYCFSPIDSREFYVRTVSRSRKSAYKRDHLPSRSRARQKIDMKNPKHTILVLFGTASVVLHLIGCKASQPSHVETKIAQESKKIVVGGKDWHNPVPND